MKVLIVESNLNRGLLWKRYIERQGANVIQVSTQTDAIIALCSGDFDVIVLDLVLDDGSALAVADFASYRRPEARVIFVTDTSVFSDGSIFAHATNACAFVQSGAPPEDLVAMVEHHAAAGRVPRPLGTTDPVRAVACSQSPG
jgi:DNA-binding NtrC family response regulator